MTRPFYFRLNDHQTIVVHAGIPFIYTYSDHLKRDLLLAVPQTSEPELIGQMARILDRAGLRFSGRHKGRSYMLVGNGSYVLSDDKTGPMVGMSICSLASLWLAVMIGLNGHDKVVKALGGVHIGGLPWEDPEEAVHVCEDLRLLLEDGELTQELVDAKAGFLYRTGVETYDTPAAILRRCEAAGFSLEAARASVASCVRAPQGGLPQLEPRSNRVLC